MVTATFQPIIGPAPQTPEWFEERFNHIGASEAAAACGVSPWKQPLDIYLEKRRLVEPFAGNDFTRLGSAMEPVIRAEFTHRTGIELISPVPLMIHPDTQFISASLDALHDTPERRPTETKCSNWRRAAEWGEEGTDQIPEEYVIQCQQQMYVVGAERCDLAVLLDGRTLRLYTVNRHEALISRMIELETELWQRIQAGDPPAPNFRHPRTLDLIKNLYGVEEGESIDLTPPTCDTWRQYRELGDQIKALEENRETAKAQVLYAMGPAAIGNLDDGRQLVRSIVNRKSYECKASSFTTLRERKAK